MLFSWLVVVCGYSKLAVRNLENLQKHFPDIKTAYVLSCTPEQGETFYNILVNDDCIAGIEINNFNSKIEPIVENVSIKDYKRRLSKVDQIQLAVAMDLAKKMDNS